MSVAFNNTVCHSTFTQKNNTIFCYGRHESVLMDLSNKTFNCNWVNTIYKYTCIFVICQIIIKIKSLQNDLYIRI